MTIAKFDFSELSDFDRKTLEVILDQYPKEARKLMQKAGTAFQRELKKRYRAETKKKTGTLLARVKRGRPYLYNNEFWQIRVKNTAPHAHLIEYGHRFKAWGYDSDKRAYVHGKHIAGKTNNDFQPVFVELVDKFTDNLLDRGFR